MLGARKGHHIAHREPQGGFFILGGLRCHPKPCVDLSGNLAVQVIQIIAGARLVGKPAMHGHVLLGDFSNQGLVTLPQKLLDAVAFADVSAQVNEGSKGFVRDRIGVGGIAGHLNGDGSVVPISTRNAIYLERAAGGPGTVFFIHREANGAVLAHHIVGGAVPVCGCKIVTPLLGGPLANNAVDDDGINLAPAGAGFVFRDVGIGYKRAVAHSVPPF